MSKNLIIRNFNGSGYDPVNLKVNIFKKDALETLIDALEQYKSRLPEWVSLAMERLVKAGYKVANERLKFAGSGDSERTDKIEFDIEKNGAKVHGTLFLVPQPVTRPDGEVFYPALAWEFGAGIYYNNGNAHPKASEFGLGVGTYPDQRRAINPGYWWYRDESGNLHYSIGTEATMPMYNASLEIIREAERIFKGAFF